MNPIASSFSTTLSHRRPLRFWPLAMTLTAAIIGGYLIPHSHAAVPTSRPYVSPEVHADRTVTFRILASKATEVTIEGGWLPSNQTLPMVKDAQGMWSITVGPLRPTVYAYWFNLDGAVVLDQANQYIRTRGVKSSVSMFDIPDTSALPWSVRDVPHGTVEMNWVPSTAYGGETRNIWVYVPPGFDRTSKKRYPVLYLLHGAGEMYLSWVESGKANLIFDNLLADGKMTPMIVVMPHTDSTDASPVDPPPAPNPLETGPSPRELDRPARYVINEVIPWAESHYPILADRKDRAIAGLSKGGALTIAIGFPHPELFSQMGIFSAPAYGFATRYPSVVANPKATNDSLDVLWIGVGRSDQASAGLRQFDAELTKDGIHHKYMETDGAHDWAVWRWCLVQFAPLLFQNGR